MSCGDSTGPESQEYSVIPADDPQPAGDRIFGINPSESDQGFIASFEKAQEAGIQVVEILLPWESIEASQGVYQDPDGVLSAIAFYGAEDVKVLLTIAVINTVKSTVPDYLEGLEYDSPEVVNAFNSMADWVFQQVPASVTVAGFAIGNEVDLVLEGDSAWNDYSSFYQQVSEHFRSGHTGIPVGVKCTVIEGLLGGEADELVSINQYSDVIMLTCYPQTAGFQVLSPETVHDHFGQIQSHFPGDSIWITEIGYQSGSEYCGSSQQKQAQFYHELFCAWDDHMDQFQLVLVNWLHDASSEMISEWEDYYGSSDPGFLEFLSTLGLRNHDHTDKYAWLQVLEETSARGW